MSSGSVIEVAGGVVEVVDNVIEVAGPSSEALSRAAELRSEGWTVFVRSTRLSASCDVVWTLELERQAG